MNWLRIAALKLALRFAESGMTDATGEPMLIRVQPVRAKYAKHRKMSLVRKALHTGRIERQLWLDILGGN